MNLRFSAFAWICALLSLGSPTGLWGEDLSKLTSSELMTRLKNGDDLVLPEMVQRGEDIFELIITQSTQNDVNGMLQKIRTGNYEEREDATAALIEMGESVHPNVREFLALHAGDPEVVKRCKLILDAPVDVNPLPKVEGIPKKLFIPAVKLLVSHEKLSDETLEKFSPLFDAILTQDTEGKWGMLLHKVSDQGLVNFVGHVLKIPESEDALYKWISRQNPQVFTELAFMVLTQDFKTNYPKFLRYSQNEFLLMRIILENFVDELDRAQEDALRYKFSYSNRASKDILIWLEGVKPMNSRAKDILEYALTDDRGKHNVLAYFLCEGLKAEPDERMRRMTYGFILDGLGNGDWVAKLKKMQLTWQDALSLLWLLEFNEKDMYQPTKEYLAEFALEVPLEDLRAFIYTQKINYRYLGTLAECRPELEMEIGECLFADLLVEINTDKLEHFSAALKKMEKYQVPAGEADEAWLGLFGVEDQNMMTMFNLSDVIKVSPEVLHKKIQDQMEWYSEKHHRGLSQRYIYMINASQGALKFQLMEEAIGLLEMENIVRQADHQELRLLIEEVNLEAGELQLYLKALGSRITVGRNNSALQLFFYGKLDQSNERSASQHFEILREGLPVVLNQPSLQTPLAMLLMMYVADDDLLEAQAELLDQWTSEIQLDEIERSDVRFALAWSGLMLAPENEQYDETWISYLQNPSAPEHLMERSLFLLDEIPGRLVPQLLKASSESEAPNWPLQYALMIAPEDPEVKEQVEKILFYSQDHRTVSRLFETLNYLDAVPSLTDFSEERIAWFLNFETEVAYQETWNIFWPYVSQGHKSEVVKLLLPHFEKMSTYPHARVNPEQLFVNDSLARNLATERVFDLLFSDDDDQELFALECMSGFGEFTEKELQRFSILTPRLKSHKNNINAIPTFFRSLLASGSNASMLTDMVQSLMQSPHPFNVDDGLACMASISTGKSERDRYFSKLGAMFEHDSGHMWPQTLSKLPEYEAEVKKMYKQALITYAQGNPKDYSEGFFISPILLGYAATFPDEFLYQWVKAQLRKDPQTPGLYKLMPELWFVLRNQYPERLPELTSDLLNVPRSSRVNYSYWKTKRMCTNGEVKDDE